MLWDGRAKGMFRCAFNGGMGNLQMVTENGSTTAKDITVGGLISSGGMVASGGVYVGGDITIAGGKPGPDKVLVAIDEEGHTEWRSINEVFGPVMINPVETVTTVKPSDKEQIIVLNKDVSVVIPAGSILKEGKITATPVEGGATFDTLNFKRVMAYNIDISTATIDKEVTLKFSYDSSKFTDKGIRPEDIMVANFWNNDSSSWFEVPVKVDTINHTVDVPSYGPTKWEISIAGEPGDYEYVLEIQTGNNSNTPTILNMIKNWIKPNIALAVFDTDPVIVKDTKDAIIKAEAEAAQREKELYGNGQIRVWGSPTSIIMISANFRVHLDVKPSFAPPVVDFVMGLLSPSLMGFKSALISDDILPKDPKTGKPNKDITQKGISEVQRQYLVLTHLNQAYLNYEKMGFEHLPYKVNVYYSLSKSPFTTIFEKIIGSQVVGGANTITKNITFLNTLVNDPEEDIRTALGHELFHLFQVNDAKEGPFPEKWFNESTAVAASNLIAFYPPYKGTAYNLYPPNTEYFLNPITLSDAYLLKVIPFYTKLREYRTANFIEYLMNKGIILKDVWDVVKKSNSGGVKELDSFLSEKGKRLGLWYSEFVRYILFNSDGPYSLFYKDEKNSKRTLYGDLDIVYRAEFQKTDREKIFDFNLIKANTAYLEGLKIKGNRHLSVSIKGVLPENEEVYVYHSILNDTKLVGSFIGANKNDIFVSVNDSDVLYILTIDTRNPNTSGVSNLSVSIKEVDNTYHYLRKVSILNPETINIAVLKSSTPNLSRASVPFTNNAFIFEIKSQNKSTTDKSRQLEVQVNGALTPKFYMTVYQQKSGMTTFEQWSKTAILNQVNGKIGLINLDMTESDIAYIVMTTDSSADVPVLVMVKDKSDEQSILLNTWNQKSVDAPCVGSNPYFTISEAKEITYINTYHRNKGFGVTPGVISILDTNGKAIKKWASTGSDALSYLDDPGQGFASNTVWEVKNPKITLPRGKYYIEDSDSSTRSCNSSSGNVYFSLVRERCYQNCLVYPSKWFPTDFFPLVQATELPL